MGVRRRQSLGVRLPPVLGLIAGVAALAAGGIAAGLELEQRVISRRIRAVATDSEPFFSLRSPGPEVTTPDGVVLHTEVDEPTSPASPLSVVFVHGFALNLDCWHFQRKHFRTHYKTVLYDQRSHGRSTRSAPELCRLPQLADDLAQVMDEVVGQGPCVLIGHSMGGMTIMRLAQTRPEWFGSRILGVGLVSTSSGDMANHSPLRAVPGRVFSQVTPPLLATLNRLPQVVESSRRAGSDLGYVVTRRMAFGSPVPVSYVEFVTQMLAQMPLDVVADFYPAFAEVDEEKAFGVLRGVETAVLGGEDDLWTPVVHTDAIIELLPGAETLRMPHCGHLGMIEHAPEFNAALDRLVVRAERSRALSS